MEIKRFSCQSHTNITTTRKGIRQHLKNYHVARARGITPNVKKMYLNKSDLIYSEVFT